MSRFLYDNGTRFEMLGQGDAAPEEAALSFDSPEAAYAYLEPFSTETRHMDTFRAVLVKEEPLFSVHRRPKHEVLRQLAWRVHSGFVSVAPKTIMVRGTIPGGTNTPRAPQPPDAAPPPTPTDEPAVEEETMQWITFQVLDDEGNEPVAGVKLEVRLPDGSLDTFTTDGDGVIHIPSLTPGTCTIERMIDDDALEVVNIE